MSNHLLDKADALMRRRSFVAGANADAAEESATSESLAAEAEDIPLLTEVIEADAATPPAAASLADNSAVAQHVEAAVREQLEKAFAERHGQLANEIEKWLDEQMPQLVIRAMDGITDHLVALLANRTRDELLPRLEAVLQPPEKGPGTSTSGE